MSSISLRSATEVPYNYYPDLLRNWDDFCSFRWLSGVGREGRHEAFNRGQDHGHLRPAFAFFGMRIRHRHTNQNLFPNPRANSECNRDHFNGHAYRAYPSGNNT